MSNSTQTYTSFSARNRRFAARTAAAAAGLITALGFAPDAEAAKKLHFDGGGYGHGVGLSQYGAYGYAQNGWNAKRIVGHYYTGTKLGEAPTKRVRVLIGTGAGSVGISKARKVCGTKVSKGASYSAVPGSGSKVKVVDASGRKVTGCGKALKASGGNSITISGHGTYRGKLVAKRTSSGFNLVNKVSLEDYLRGVVPAEMPASWHQQALQAQAIVARSYALATRVNGDGFDMYDDTRSQVYNGRSAETKATNAAVKKTAGQVVTYKGKVATTYFHSTSGGRTADIREGFSGTSAVPYLKSVNDRYDNISPLHDWSVKMSLSSAGSKLAGLYSGKLRNIKVTKTGSSGRIVAAKVIGSSGSTTVSGDTLRFKLGLKSHYFKVSKG